VVFFLPRRTGGSFEKNGGSVVDTVTMTNGAKSHNTRLSVTGQRILELENKFGVELLQHFLKEEQLYGGNHKAFTDAEARTLLGAASLDEARNRIAEARQERDWGIRPEMVPGTSLNIEEISDPQTHAAPLSQDSTSNLPKEQKHNVPAPDGKQPDSSEAIEAKKITDERGKVRNSFMAAARFYVHNK
jgi:hypothetical protein